MARLELEEGTDVLLLEDGDALLLELIEIVHGGGGGATGGGGIAVFPAERRRRTRREDSERETGLVQGQPATLPERIVARELDKLGIRYIFQQSFLGGRFQSGGLVSDFYIPSLSLILSILGTYWHASPSVRAKDILQRIAVLSQGITTIFIREEDVMARARYYVSQALLGNDLSGVRL